MIADSSRLNAATRLRRRLLLRMWRWGITILGLSIVQITVRFFFHVVWISVIIKLFEYPGAFLNDTIMPVTFNYNNPPAPFIVNGRSDPTSQRFHVSVTIVLYLKKSRAVSETKLRIRARSHSTSPFQLLHPSISRSSGLFSQSVPVIDHLFIQQKGGHW